MKKIINTAFLLVAVFAATNSYAQVSFGLKGSFNMFNLSMKDIDGKKVEASMIPVFDAGIFVELPIAKEFFIRPELLYAVKGAKSKNETPEVTTHLSYVELPILFLYKGDLSDGKVLIGFGPYFAMGVGGKMKSGSNSIDVKFKNDVAADAEPMAVYFKPLDIGAKMMAGYELAVGLSVAINASLGLTNIEPKYAGQKLDSSTKNVGFGLTLGYRFGR